MSDSDMNAPSGDASAGRIYSNIPLLEELINSLLSLELAAFLEDQKNQSEDAQNDNKRNGYYYRIFKAPVGEIHIRVPRDRNGAFHPHILPKKHSVIPQENSTIFSLFFQEPEDEAVLSMADSFYKDFSESNAQSLSSELLKAVHDYHLDIKTKR